MKRESPAESIDPRPRSARRRWPWIALGSVLLLVVAALVLLPLLLDPETYRGRIERALRDATGWEAELGEMEFSLLRGPALSVRPARLFALEGGSAIEVERIGVRAELRPLLRGELRVRSIDLIRPEIEIHRASEEEGWILPAVLSSTESSSEPAESEKKGLEVSIDRVRVRDGVLRIEDGASDPPLVVGLRDLDLDLSPTDGRIDGEGELLDGGSLKWSGDLVRGIKLDLREVPTALFVPWLGEELLHPGGEVSGEIEAALPERIDGSLTGRRILLLDGTSPFDELRSEFHLAAKEGGWLLDSLSVAAGGLRIEGGGPLLPDTALTLDLPSTPIEEVLRAADSIAPVPLDLEPPGAVRARIRIDQRSGEELTYAATGELTAARFAPDEVLPDAENVRAEFTLNPTGSLEIRVREGTVGGGPLTGTARLDSLFPPGTLTFQGGLRDAVLGKLLGGLVHDAAGRVEGPTALDASMRLDLGREELDLHALGGRLELDSRRVNLPGWDLERAIRLKLAERAGALSGVAALLDKVEPGNDAREAGTGAVAEVVEKLLDRLDARIDFDDLPWKLESVGLAAKELSAAGSGTFDPIEGSVDLRFTVRLGAGKTADLVGKNRELRLLVSDDGELSLPVRVSGPLLRPSIGVELRQVLSDRGGKEKREEAVKGLLKGLLDRRKKESE